MFADRISDHASFIIVALTHNCLRRFGWLASDILRTPVESFEIYGESGEQRAVGKRVDCCWFGVWFVFKLQLHSQ